MYVENYLFSPSRLMECESRIEGYEMLTNSIPKDERYKVAEYIAEEWTMDWSEDEGFGSSDFTFALKNYLDELIRMTKLPLKTEFNPYLSITKINN